MPTPDRIDPHILGQRIAEARKARGKTQEEAAAFLGCSRPTYIAVEKGQRAAKAEEIVKLAPFLGRKVHELVRPAAPVVDLGAQLRAVAEKMKSADRAPLFAAIDELVQWAEDYRELEQIMKAPLRFNYPAEVPLSPHIDPAEVAESEAIRERQRLGLGDQPIIDLRAMLEWDVGLRIFYGCLPASVAGMYACTAELGCCLLVNCKHPAERRRLSMLREYGHLLVDRYKPRIAYLAVPGRKPANERFAEAFALAFLMPAASVRQRFHDIVRSTSDFQVADLRRLSRLYFVSVEAMALRLERLGLISKRGRRFLKQTKVSPASASEVPGLQPQPTGDQPFPERYQFLVVSAYERGDLGDSDLAHYLRCDIVTAREIVASTLSAREVIEPSGEEHDVRLDFRKSLLA